MKKLFSLSAIALLSALPLIASADAPAKAAVCSACHGADGAAPIADNYPKLAGQNKGYLVSSLKAYKAGQRQGGLSAVMTGQAAALSDAEIDALATYYSSK